MTYCVCCRTRPGSLRSARRPGAAVRALVTVCHHCEAQGHRIESCLLCPAPVPRWQCGWVAHFAESHPDVLVKLQNDPYPELTVVPTTRKLGTVFLP